MSDYAPNSHKFKEEQKNAVAEKPKTEKVISGKATVKKNEIRKFRDIFFAEDFDAVKSYICQDVLIPLVKKAIYDIGVGSLDTLMFGKNGNRPRTNGNTSYISYGSNYNNRGGSRFVDERTDTRPNDVRSYEDIVIPTREEATDVLNRLDELIENYKRATVGDYYDACGLTCDYTAYNYGWINLRSAEVVRVRDGYKVKLPKAMPIDKR